MNELKGMTFHSAEREVERLEKQLDEARQEADALRRQVEHAQDAIELGNATNMAAKTVMLDMRQQRDAARQEAADLRRQVEHANNWRDSAILEANEARQEAAELRRQLAAAQETIAALRLRLSLDNPAYRMVAGDELLPPNRQTVADVRIVARQRPDILIADDDFADDPRGAGEGDE